MTNGKDDKRLTRAERAKLMEKKRTGDVEAPKKTGQWLWTPPPRQVRRNAVTPQSTAGNQNFQRYTSDDGEYDEVANPPDDVVVEVIPNAPAAPIVQADPVLAPVDPLPVVEVVAEPVAEAPPQVVVRDVDAVSSADESAGDAVAADLAQRRRRRRRARRNRRRYVHPRPPVVYADPHLHEVLIDDYLLMREDPTQNGETD